MKHRCIKTLNLWSSEHTGRNGRGRGGWSSGGPGGSLSGPVLVGGEGLTEGVIVVIGGELGCHGRHRYQTLLGVELEFLASCFSEFLGGGCIREDLNYFHNPKIFAFVRHLTAKFSRMQRNSSELCNSNHPTFLFLSHSSQQISVFSSSALIYRAASYYYFTSFLLILNIIYCVIKPVHHSFLKIWTNPFIR